MDALVTAPCLSVFGAETGQDGPGSGCSGGRAMARLLHEGGLRSWNTRLVLVKALTSCVSS